MEQIDKLDIKDPSLEEIKEAEENFESDEELINELRIIDPNNTIQLHLADISKYPLLSYEDEQLLGKKMEEGDSNARETLICSNTRLVIAIAKNIYKMEAAERKHLEFIDLVEEGYTGLIKAVDKWDYKRGLKFSTYATWWVKQAITRGLQTNGYMVSIPVHIQEAAKGIYKIKKQYLLETGEEADAATIEKLSDGRYSKDTVELINSINPFTDSLDRKIKNDEDGTLHDLTPDKDEMTPNEYANRANLRDDLYMLFDKLNEKEKKVIILRYGFDNGIDKTLEEVGEELSLTRERVRQIQERALEKLRKYSDILKNSK